AAPVGSSFLLELLVDVRTASTRLAHEFETLTGTQVTEVWILRFLRGIAMPVLLATLVVGWLSTSFMVVPLGDRGVQVAFGRYVGEPLPSGLHVSWPWPFGEIQIVQTERVREVSLGFEKDLSGPQLWTER